MQRLNRQSSQKRNDQQPSGKTYDQSESRPEAGVLNHRLNQGNRSDRSLEEILAGQCNRPNSATGNIQATTQNPELC